MHNKVYSNRLELNTVTLLGILFQMPTLQQQQQQQQKQQQQQEVFKTRLKKFKSTQTQLY